MVISVVHLDADRMARHLADVPNAGAGLVSLVTSRKRGSADESAQTEATRHVSDVHGAFLMLREPNTLAFGARATRRP